MKLPGDYTALQRISIPDNVWVTAFQPGDDVPAGVVENWSLTPEQVELNETYKPPRPADTSDDRAAWESYVVGQGTDLDDARAASLGDLKAFYDAPAEAPEPVLVPDDVQPADAPERPADGALKADWVKYAVAMGADEAWANDPSTTKEDLKGQVG